MVRIEFTSHLSQHLDCPATDVDADTLGSALERVFDSNPKLRGYVLDDHGSVRKHVAVFVDGKLLHDRNDLNVRLRDDSEIYVMQALSGG